MIFYDVEVQNWFDDLGVGGGPAQKFYEPSDTDLGQLKVSFVGVYDDQKDRYYSIWEDDMSKLAEIFQKADTIVGYNSWGFDNNVVAPYFDFDMKKIPHIDLMIAMKNIVGFRPKLDDLAKANIGEGKIGKGADAVGLWKDGKLEELEKYCLEDVRLTYEVWRIGEEAGSLKYYDKKGFIQQTEVDWDKGRLGEGTGKKEERLVQESLL